ncbi:hypothetical protein CFBP6625_06315 [Agrobacterium tumefaciens]|nr:hypothetical protein CFBP6625_06315 [Agrobacterium tumefaciens]
MTTPQTPSVIGDFSSPLIWTAAFGKALVKKGILTKADVITELKAFKGVDAELDINVDNMIATINRW